MLIDAAHRSSTEGVGNPAGLYAGGSHAKFCRGIGRTNLKLKIHRFVSIPCGRGNNRVIADWVCPCN